jgi:hypothetical protein
MSLFRTQTAFMQNNGWQNQSLNALRYNTSQVGSVLPLCYGTVRQQVNLIALGDYMGPGGGKKGKGVGPLPLGGTNTVQSGKGGGGGKGGGKKGSKKGTNFSVDVAFGMCQGPITFNDGNQVFANSSVEAFSAAQLNFYAGQDGQMGDPTFDGLGSGINYSGTCWITGTPMILGMSPAIPNLGFELSAFLFDTGGPFFPFDANPGLVIRDFLTNIRYGAGFPGDNLDDLAPGDGTTFGDYCQAAGLLVSVSLDGQQRAAQWMDGLVNILNSAIVVSGELLKIIPYGDLQLIGNGATWNPNLVPVYSLTDDDFIPWHPHQDDTANPEVGQDDPIIVTRTNPADAFNWFSIEYLDRDNFYNSTILAVYDQGAIDQYGLRIGNSLPGKCFASATSAQVAAQLVLQRSQYIRNSPYKFQIGWDKALLEPMDIVLLTGKAGDLYLQQEAVRVLSIEENDNGDLTVEAEKIQQGQGAPLPPLVYFEITILQLHGNGYALSEIRLGFGSGDFPLWSPTAGPGGDEGTLVYGAFCGNDPSSVGLYDAAFFGSGYTKFGVNENAGAGIPYYPNGVPTTYCFAVDTVNGDFFWKTCGGGVSPEWIGDNTYNTNAFQEAPSTLNSGGQSTLAMPAFGYDITGFGTKQPFYIVVSGCYWNPGSESHSGLGPLYGFGGAGPQEVVLNLSGPFACAMPDGAVPWGGGITSDAPVVSISGLSAVLGSDPTVPNIAGSLRSTTGHMLRPTGGR